MLKLSSRKPRFHSTDRLVSYIYATPCTFAFGDPADVVTARPIIVAWKNNDEKVLGGVG